MPTTTKTYRVSDEVIAAIAAAAELHGGVDKALRRILIEHPKRCLGEHGAPDGKHMEPTGTAYHRSADLDEYLEQEREANAPPPPPFDLPDEESPRPRFNDHNYRVEDMKTILVEKIPENSPEGQLRKRMRE